jgi:predicted GNAT family N-acyltransferase
MNKHVEQILAAGIEAKYLKTKYRNVSQMTAVSICLFAGIVVYIIQFLAAKMIGIDSHVALKQQAGHRLWFAIFIGSIPLSIVPAYLCVTPIFSKFMLKKGWLTEEESVTYKKYRRFPKRCIKNSQQSAPADVLVYAPICAWPSAIFAQISTTTKTQQSTALAIIRNQNPMKYKVVEKLSDLQIKKLHELYQNEWFTEGRSIENVIEMLKHTDFIFGFCDPETNELVGFARVISDWVYKAFVFDVIVDKRLRNKGMGNFIMNTLFNHQILKKVSHIELYCPERLVLFYEKLGFEVRTSLLLRRNTIC